MVKRSARGRQQTHSSKTTRTQGSSRKNEDVDWNISSDEANGNENLDMNNSSDHSEEEMNPEDLETVEERRLKLAKEYVDKIRLEEEEKEEDDDSDLSATDNEGVEDRIEARLKKEADEAKGRIFKEVASKLRELPLPEGRFCKGHLMPVTCTDISGDEKYIVSGGKDCKASLWDVETGKVVTIFEGKRERSDSVKRKAINCHRGEVLAVQISHDGKYVVTAGREGLIRIWDSRVGQTIGEEHVESVMENAGSTTGRHIVHTTECKDVLRGHRGMISSLLLQRDNILYSGGVDSTIKLWNVIDTTYIDTLYGHDSGISSISGNRTALFNRNNTRILSSSTDNSIRMWKIEANNQLVFRGRRIDISMECSSMVSQTHFVSGDLNGSLNVFSVDKKKSLFSVKNAHGFTSDSDSTTNHSGKWIVSCASLPYTNLVASGSYSDCVRMWDLNPSNRGKDGELLKPVTTIPIDGFVNSISFAPSGRFMVMGVGQEHRMGRWWRLKGVKNGIYIQNLNLD